MGGLLLKKFGCVRYELEDFIKVEIELSKVIENLLDTTVYPTKYVRNKTSFGDMDILVYKNSSLTVDFIKDKLQTLEGCLYESIFINDSVLSFAYTPSWKSESEKLQIDLILVKPENWETSTIFFNYGDLGNLMGKLLTRFDIKYGYDGIKYVFNFKDHSYKINISKNMKEAFSFLGLSYDKYLTGFKSNEDVFEYICSSKYFMKYIYEFKSLNHINKKRNKRRPNYISFLEFIKNKEDKYSKVELKQLDMLDIINRNFRDSNIYKHIADICVAENIKYKIAKKWNGKWISDKYGIEGKELGQVMLKYKNKFGNTFQQYIISNTFNDIKKDFDIFYTSLRQN